MRSWLQYKKFSGEQRAEGMRFLMEQGPAEFRHVACGPPLQCIWLGDRKVRSQIAGTD